MQIRPYLHRSIGVRMTPAYPGHRPHEPETIALTIEPLRRLLQVPQVKRIVVTNYVSSALNRQIEALSAETKLPLKFTPLKKLDQMQRAHLSKTQNVEGLWEFGESNQNQLDLFA